MIHFAKLLSIFVKAIQAIALLAPIGTALHSLLPAPTKVVPTVKRKRRNNEWAVKCFSPLQKEEIARLFNTGVSEKAISRLYDKSPMTIRNVLREKGYSPRRRGRPSK